HHHDGCIWYVHAHLDHRGGNQHVDLSYGEGAHHPILLGRCHAAVQGCDNDPGIVGPSLKLSDGVLHGSERTYLVLTGRQLCRHAFFLDHTGRDRRAHHVHLSTGGHILTRSSPHSGCPIGHFEFRHSEGVDAEPACRKFADGGHLKVTERGERHGPRDRSGRHGQHMRRLA